MGKQSSDWQQLTIWCQREDKPDQPGLSVLQFLIISSLVSGAPYGIEYAVLAVGVGWTMLGFLFLAFFLSIPSALMCSELISMMPTNHGSIAWCYRAFRHFKLTIFGKPIGDLLAFINAANTLTYYLVGTAYCPIVFAAYLETAAGDLGWAGRYFIKIAIVLVAFGINCANINIIGTTINTILLVSMSPLIIGFFWRLPDIEWSQWTEQCSTYDPAFYIGIVVFYSGGYSALGSIGGELNMSSTKLTFAYIGGVMVSVLWILIPIITAATIPYSSCYDWYDGYFAVAYGDICTALYWCVLLSSLFVNFTFEILYTMIVARMLWALSQPHFSMLPDGTMYLEDEVSLMPTIDIENLDDFDASTAFKKREKEQAPESQPEPAAADNAGDDGDDNKEEDAPVAEPQIIQIQLGIVHPLIGWVWDRTGCPLGALIVYTVITLLELLFMTYDLVILLIVYTYLSIYVFVCAAYIVTKVYEPDAPRKWQIPGGQTGGMIVALGSSTIMAAIAIYIGITYYYWSALVWLVSNIIFVIYYFTVKKCLDERDPNHEYAPVGQDNRGLKEILMNMTS